MAIPRGAELPKPTTNPRFFVTWSDGSMRCDLDGDLCVEFRSVAADVVARAGELRGRWLVVVAPLPLFCMLSNETVFLTSGAGEDLLLLD